MNNIKRANKSEIEKIFVELSHVEKENRDKGIEILYDYISKNRKSLNEHKITYICKGLFYYYWLCYSMEEQKKAALKICRLIHKFNNKNNKKKKNVFLFVQCFFQVMSNKYDNLDIHRLNKYLFLFRVFQAEILMFFHMNAWNNLYLKKYNKIFLEYFDDTSELYYNYIDTFIKEFLGNEYFLKSKKQEEPNYNTKQFLLLIDPFFKILCKTDQKYVMDLINKKVFYFIKKMKHIKKKLLKKKIIKYIHICKIKYGLKILKNFYDLINSSSSKKKKQKEKGKDKKKQVPVFLENFKTAFHTENEQNILASSSKGIQNGNIKKIDEQNEIPILNHINLNNNDKKFLKNEDMSTDNDKVKDINGLHLNNEYVTDEESQNKKIKKKKEITLLDILTKGGKKRKASDEQLVLQKKNKKNKKNKEKNKNKSKDKKKNKIKKKYINGILNENDDEDDDIDDDDIDDDDEDDDNENNNNDNNNNNNNNNDHDNNNNNNFNNNDFNNKDHDNNNYDDDDDDGSTCTSQVPVEEMENNADKKKKSLNKKITIFEKRHDDEYNLNVINNMQKMSNGINNNNHADLKNDEEKVPLYFTNNVLNSSDVVNSIREDENINVKKKNKTKKKKKKNLYIESNSEYNQTDESEENISSDIINHETQEINGNSNLINGKNKNVINNGNVLLTLNPFDIKTKNKDTIILSKKKRKINKENKKKLLQNKLKQKNLHNLGKHSVKDICDKNNVVRKTILKKGKSKSTVTKKVHFNLKRNTIEYIPRNKRKNINSYLLMNNFRNFLNIPSFV
ncbi:nucleolar protein Nop52, putative [Plasmodium sp. gorilla clade G2]|uniref:nucleolar protein Nop52, putative n=1 Tax=Plasmodium sp. gorilla clade G2 TaxID=880535 RepID=UPI000D20DCD4|nr:nucleolar protein Nop52, putative [Plasmodium sp. gorilla clade G2]SOV14484.1 nucleolar protein Nop52, putative [Plasmodium sp. gorilla clade G2]